LIEIIHSYLIIDLFLKYTRLINTLFYQCDRRNPLPLDGGVSTNLRNNINASDNIKRKNKIILRENNIKIINNNDNTVGTTVYMPK
jgi:hypothetical protein